MAVFPGKLNSAAVTVPVEVMLPVLVSGNVAPSMGVVQGVWLPIPPPIELIFPAPSIVMVVPSANTVPRVPLVVPAMGSLAIGTVPDVKAVAFKLDIPTPPPINCKALTEPVDE